MNKKYIYGIIAIVVVIALSYYWYPRALPDLKVETLTHSPVKPTVADEIIFKVVVKNSGVRAARSSTLSFKVGGETNPETFAIPALEPHEMFTVQRRVVLGIAQNYHNTIIVDVDNEVAESDEDNNEVTYNVEVMQESIITIILTRHAEYDIDMRAERAQKLADVLCKVDLDAIYTTDFPRCWATIQVLADTQNLTPIIYNSVDEVASNVKNLHTGQVVFIVGHSGSAQYLDPPPVAGIIDALVEEENNIIIGYEEFNNLYIVTIFDSGKWNILNLQYGETPLCTQAVTIGICSSRTEDDSLTHIIVETAEQDINDYCFESEVPFTFDLEIEDNGGTASMFLECIQTFKAMGVNLLIGHECARSQFQAALSYINENNMILLSATSTPPFLEIAPYQVTTDSSICDPFIGPAITEMLWSYGIKACFVIQSLDSSANGVFEVFEEEYIEKGGVILERIRIPSEVTEYSPYLEQANTRIGEAMSQYGSDHVGVAMICPTEITTIMFQILGYPALSNAKWFDSDIMALSPYCETWTAANHLQVISPYLAPPISDGFNDLYEKVYLQTGIRLSYFDALLYDACWLYALSVAETGSTESYQISQALTGIAENYFENRGWCSLYTKNRVVADYDIWGCGIVNNAPYHVRYGFFNGSTGQIKWYPTGITLYGLETEGLNPPGP